MPFLTFIVQKGDKGIGSLEFGWKYLLKSDFDSIRFDYILRFNIMAKALNLVFRA